MVQAGFRGPKPLTTFYFFRFASPFIFMIVAAFYMFVIKVVDWPTMNKLTLVMAAAVAGFYAPNLYLKNRIDKRRASIMQAFPDALGSDADLCGGRDVHRGGDHQGQPGDGAVVHRPGRGVVAAVGRTVLSAGPSRGL